jgi:Protein of unknown function (DUF3572)
MIEYKLVENPFINANRPLPMRGNQDRLEAESLAIEALSFLARDSTRIAAFLETSGLGPDHLRDAVREPGFLAAVLDHLMMDEPLLLMFSENAEIDPNTVPAARRVLGAGYEGY